MINNTKKIFKKALIVFIIIVPMLCMGDHVPGIVLVRLKRGIVELPYGVTEGNIQSIIGNQDLRNYLANEELIKIGKIFRRFDSEDTLLQLENGERVKVHDLSLVFRLSFNPNINIEIVIDSLEQYSDVIYAEPDYIGVPVFSPNDDSFSKQWALEQNSDCDIDADSAWDIETGNYNIKIGIIDEGIDYYHEDMGGSFGPGYKVCGGWDYIDNDNDPRPEFPDGEKHGTHVAGIASALTNNNHIGIAGLSGGTGGMDIGCALYSYRTQLCGGGNISDMAEAIADAVMDGVAVMNVSISFEDYSEVAREAVCYAYKWRRIFVAARGNNNDFSLRYPACFDYHWVISVGATDKYDVRWVNPETGRGSSMGQGIDVVAPGKDILSTIPVFNPGEERYELKTGTSMAAPHVTGLAALIRSKAWPTIFLHSEDVAGIIATTAKDLGDPGYDDYFGAGRINAYYALKYFSYEQSLRKYTVTPTDCIFTSYYQKTFIGISDLDDGTYNVQRFGFYRDVWLPADTLKFLGIWGLGRSTTGYSDADPNYGEGCCDVGEIPYLPGCYRVSTYIYKVWDLNWNFKGWFPVEPNHPVTPSNVFLVYRVFNVKFLPPHGLYADNITETSLTLHWSYYYPELIDGYTVKRDGQVIGNLPSSQLYWDDSGLEPGHTYHYEVLARKGDIYSTPAHLDVSTLPQHYIAQSNYPKMSAYNNGDKVVKNGDNVYVTYTEGNWGNREMHILLSTDGGSSFTDVFNPYPEWGRGYISHPAITMDDNGTPYATWGVIYWPSGNAEDYWLRRYYCAYYVNDSWQIKVIYNKLLNYDPLWQPIEDSIASPSISTSFDSGYVAFKIVWPNKICVARFLLSNPDNQHDEIIPNTEDVQEYVSIGYDPGSKPDSGRIVVAGFDYNEIMKLHYRSIGSERWSNVELTDFGACGSPSLWVGTNKLRVAFEGYDYDPPYPEGLLSTQFLWSSVAGDYIPELVEFITQNCDYPGFYEGCTYLAAEDVVLWRFEDDIWYSRKLHGEWTTPNNTSLTPEQYSSYPQGITFWDGKDYKLIALWTEQIGNDYYLIRNIITIPDATPPDASGPQGNDAQYTGLFKFENIYPNPTKGIMKIRFMSPDQRRVTVNLYDVTGRVVKNIFDGEAKNGLNEIPYSSKNLASGVYFVRLITDDKVKTEKVIFYR